MRKLIYRTKSKFTFGNLFAREFHAEVLDAEEDKLLWQVSGKKWRDFQILDSQGAKVLAEEQYQGNQKWALGILYNNRIFEYEDFPRVIAVSGSYYWGDSGKKLLLSLEEDVRVFRDERFTILHEDYHNHLQIMDTKDIADEFLAVWFSFWNWNRQPPVDNEDSSF